jgi:hypothetical protein
MHQADPASVAARPRAASRYFQKTGGARRKSLRGHSPNASNEDTSPVRLPRFETPIAPVSEGELPSWRTKSGTRDSSGASSTAAAAATTSAPSPARRSSGPLGSAARTSSTLVPPRRASTAAPQTSSVSTGHATPVYE